MNLMLADMPLESDAQIHWLEEHLVGLELRALASELAAIHGDVAPAQPLDSLLAAERGAVLSAGLKILPRERFQILLKQPRLLFDLQSLVIDEGGAYWNQIQNKAPHDEKILRGWEQLNKCSNEQNAGTINPMPASNPFRWRWISQIAAAAMLTVAALGIYHLAVPTESARAQWGWNKSDAFSGNLAQAAYLNRLADTAQDWFNAKPSDASETGKRIGQLLQGCAKLLNAPHAPLATNVRDDLLEHCQKWMAQLDDQLTQLNAGRDPAAVRNDVNELVKKMQQYLRDSAKT